MDVRYLTRVPVGMLRYGLYVAELDRPWREVPVMFQGFEIRTEDELKVLRQHCNFAYIEAARSREDAYAALEVEIREPGAEGSAKPGQTDIAAVFGSARQPEKRLFAERLQSAAAGRAQALDYLDQALRDARLGRTLNSRYARAVVEDMTAQVTGNASAMMWLTNLKSKDEYSTVHSLNVCVLTLAFGLCLGLRNQQLEDIGLGALLHDVGKVKQPPELLRKKSPLNADDWEWVRRHPDEGCAVLSNSNDLPREVLDIVQMHHERIDGQGFPRGLKGEEIPYHARIVGLVNLYDSLTTERPYRPGRTADEVLQELYAERDKTFGAELVQEFIQCIGVYPIGSLVELDNGALGVVVGSTPTSRLKPTVLLVCTPSGEYYEKRLLLNLAAEPDVDGGPTTRYIRRVVDPAHYDIDVSALVAFEFGVDW